MKKILFKPEFIPLIQSGKKTQTRRIHDDMSKPKYEIGEVVEYGSEGIVIANDSGGNICEAMGFELAGKLKIIEVKKQRLGEVTGTEAQAEGFKNAFELITMGEIYGTFDISTEVYAYIFEVVKC